MTRLMLYRVVILLAALLILASCNFPMINPAQPNPGMIYTAAAETAMANATLLAQPRPTITFFITPLPSQTTTPVPGSTLAPTNSPAQTATLGAGTTPPAGTAAADCDQARFVEDVTIPDGTVFAPAERFTKTWRLENTGTCTWTSSYSLVFVEGDRLGAQEALPLSSTNIPPGSEVLVSVEMTAPDSNGRYRGDWKLRNSGGQVFGVGEEGDKTFWVQIDVGAQEGISYDFLARASSADWATVSGSRTALAFNGNPDSPAGFAGIVDSALQEDGRESARILATFPPQVNNSLIEGLFSPYTVQSGDHLLGRFGFLADSGGDCGPGEAIFRISYQVGANIRPLGEWTKRCDGRLQVVDIDLDSLRGQTVEFLIAVDTAGEFSGDRAFWTSLRVER